MKVCIEIAKAVVYFPDGTHKVMADIDTGFNRLELVMSLLKSNIQDLIEEKEGEMLNNRVKEYASRQEKATRSDRRWTAEEMEDFEKNSVEIKVF